MRACRRFCSWPDFAWALTPKAKLQMPLGKTVVLTTEVRANLYTGGSSRIYPYKSGLAFLAGVEFRVGPGPGDSYQPPVPEPPGDLR